MTSVLEKTLSIIAPHRCIICGNYNNVVCLDCAAALPKPAMPFCVLCGDVTQAWRLCTKCAPQSALSGVWAAGVYDGVLKHLIHQFKFEHARAAYEPLAAILVPTLPFLDDSWVVTAIPTVSGHVRARSFDHAKLLAQEVAQKMEVPFKRTLLRKQNVQQIGHGRAERLMQASQAFIMHPRVDVRGKRVLIVDDVCTTGATLSAAAAVLKGAGAKEVWGVVVAWKKLD